MDASAYVEIDFVQSLVRWRWRGVVLRLYVCVCVFAGPQRKNWTSK